MCVYVLQITITDDDSVARYREVDPTFDFFPITGTYLVDTMAFNEASSRSEEVNGDEDEPGPRQNVDRYR